MRQSFRLATALTAGALLLTACGSAPDDKPADAADDTFPTNVELDENFDPNGHFSYAGAYPPSSFDPFSSASGLDQTYLAPVYDRLIYRAPDGSLEPMLATEWTPSEDGKYLEVTLREGLTFTDGAPFDAEAVKTNLERYMEDTSKLKQELSQVDDVEVIDELTVRINVTDSLGALPATLAARAGMMVSPNAIAADNVTNNPVGIGPYTASEAIPGTSVALTKTEDYWDPEVQRVATMDLFGMPEGQTRYNALVGGQLTASEISAEQIDPAQGKDFSILSGPTPLLYFFSVNTAEAPFDDINVRTALNLAIDREGIGDGLFEGYCKPQIQLWPESSEMYDEDFGDGLEHFPYDPQQAKELMTEAGVDPQQTFDAVLTNSSTSTKLAEIIQSNLEEVGMKISVNPVPSGGIVENFGIAKTMPTAVSGYTGPPDPAAVVERNFTPTALYNPGGDVDPAMDAAATEGANAVDPDERKEAYAEYMNAFVEAVPNLVPICMAYRVVAYTDGVSNLWASSDYVDLRGVAVTE
ncbi:MAG: ABC transporter substrate-binding protein [Cumulibacter sp.]